jgi:hypothetical protein
VQQVKRVAVLGAMGQVVLIGGLIEVLEGHTKHVVKEDLVQGVVEAEVMVLILAAGPVQIITAGSGQVVKEVSVKVVEDVMAQIVEEAMDRVPLEDMDQLAVTLSSQVVTAGLIHIMSLVVAVRMDDR